MNRRTAARAGCTLGITVAFVVGLATGASAHAVLQRTTPAAGSVVATAPAEVTLDFGEPIELTPNAIRVYDGSLRRADAGAAGHLTGRRDTVGVRLRPDLGSGTYTVTYRVISADSHPVAGAFTFSIDAPSPVRGAIADLNGGSRAVGIALGTARFVEYAGLVAGLGGLVFFLLWPAGRRDRAARRVVRGGFVALLAGSVAALFLEAPYAAGEGFGKVVDGSVLSTILTSHFGVAIVLRIIVVVGVLAFFRRLLDRGPYGYPSAVLGVAVVLADTFADAGHSVVNDNYGLAQLSDGAHVLAMTVWLGGLVMLIAIVFRRDRDALPAVLPRFSAVALACIAVIVGTGSYQAVRNVGYWAALVDTTYGRLVLAKIGGLLVIVGLGYMARRFVQRQDFGEVAGLQRGLVAEVAIGLGVLVVTAVLVATVQGKAAYAAPVSRTIVTPSLRLTIDVVPAKVGPSDIRVRAFTRGGAPLAMQDMTGSLRLPAQDVGPLPVIFTFTRSDRAHAPLTLAAPGTWQLVLDVQTSPTDTTTVATTFTVT